MRVHFLGVRGSTPAPGADYTVYGGHTSSVAIARDGGGIPNLVLDAGTGIRRLTPLCDGNPFVGTILVTHLHWDHVHGLPFFAAGDHDGARVSFVLPEQLDGADAKAVLARGMSPPHFPIGPEGLRGEWQFCSLSEGRSVIEGYDVLAREIPHKGGRTFGYRVSDGRSTLAYLSDHCPTSKGPGPEGFGAYHEAAVALASEVDLLIHDAQLLPEEVATDARFGHSAADYAIGLGRAAGARRVALFHHRPDRTDDELDALSSRVASDPGVFVAREVTVIDL